MKNNRTGTSLGTVIQTILIILKLANLINWSWKWVLAPIWVPASIILLIYLIKICCELRSLRRLKKTHKLIKQMHKDVFGKYKNKTEAEVNRCQEK